MKRVLTLIIALMMMLPIVTFADVSDWAVDFVDEAQMEGNYDQRLFSDYQDNISRKDFAYIAVRVYEIITGDVCVPGDANFNDTDDPFVLKAKNHNLVSGYGNGNYGPDNRITREDLAVLFRNVLKQSGVVYSYNHEYTFADDDRISDYAKEAVYIAYDNKIVSGVGNDQFNPKGYATKEHAIIMLVKLENTFKDKPIKVSNDRPYDWYIDQADTGVASNDNCGPSSAVMAAMFQKGDFSFSAEDARGLYRPEGGWWYTSDIESFFNEMMIEYEMDHFDGSYELRKVINDGDAVLLCIDTSYLTELDILDNPIGKFYGYDGGHFLIVKGYEMIGDQLYFEVYDSNNWHETNSDNIEKGINRLYPENELSEAIMNWWAEYFIIKK